MFYYFDLLGTAAFAASGVLAAIHKRMDFFGIFIIAFVTAVGGGTLRDLLLGADIAWMKDLNYMYVTIVTTIFSMFFHREVGKHNWSLAILDSIGMGVFTVVGIEKGLMYDHFPLICIALGTMTACFGGVIRDILANEIPIIFRKEIYATACIAGGSVYFGLQYLNVPSDQLTLYVASTVVVIRVLSLYFDLSLPNIYSRDED